jgi:uncharacterized damage-inducible protein DinB
MRPLSRSALAPALAATAMVAALAAIPAQAAPSTPKAGSFKADLLRDLDGVSEQIVQLAQAVPAEKYTWRPGEGVRSVAEAYLHIAAGNYEILGFTPYKVANAPDLAKFETSTTDKAQVVAALEKSFHTTRETIEKIPDSALDQPVKPGSKYTVRAALLGIAGHAHEHLGQEIAYARMNGVVPPWSARQQQQQQAQPKSGR